MKKLILCFVLITFSIANTQDSRRLNSYSMGFNCATTSAYGEAFLVTRFENQRLGADGDEWFRSFGAEILAAPHSCGLVEIKGPRVDRDNGNVMGWDTSMENLVSGHIICSGCRYSKSLNLNNFTFTVELIGSVGPLGLTRMESQPRVYNCTVILDWESFLEGYMSRVC